MKIGRRLTPVPWRPAIDRFLESTVSAGAVIRLLIPVLLYVCLHIAGWLAPDHLWGVDQLHYYSDWVGCVYVLACLGAVFMALRWGQKLDEVLSRILLSIRGSGVARAISALLAAVTFLVLAWVGQTREHYLGDSKAWLRYLELTVNPDSDFDVTRSIKSFAFPGWEHVPQAEPLDFLLHLWLYEWTIPYGWSAADAYASFSIAAGLVFGVVVWRIAGQLSHTTETRLTLTGLLLTLGTAQLFFGYGESYTLVTVAGMGTCFYGIRALRGGSVMLPVLFFLLSVALHLQAIALAPSVGYVLWRRLHAPGARYLQSACQRRMIVMAGVGCGLWAYTWIYPYALPLLQAETGRYALLSPGHAANLLNQVLLLSPFLLLWPAEAVLRQGTRDPEHWFLLWASVGTSALVVGHDAFLGGRDWDLLSLPAPYLLLWGFVALPALRDKSHLRLVRYAVLPIMAAHTALFIGIGARPVAAKERVLSLMERGNRAEHYREFELGYHLLGDGQDPLTAVKHFSRAVQLASTEGTEALGTRVRYQLYLAAALCSSGNWGECLAVTDSILRAGEQLSPNARVLLFRNRAMALLGVARLGGRAAVVDSLRRLATEVVSVLVVDEPTSGNYNMLAHLRANAGDLLGARNALVRSVEINPRQGIVQFALGEVYAKTGDKSRALDHLERAAELDSSHAEKVRVLVESLKLATPD